MTVFTEAIQQAVAAHAAYSSADYQKHAERAMRPLRSARSHAAQAFADLMGWKLARTSFSLRTLARNQQHDGGKYYRPCPADLGNLLDHAEYYRYRRYAVALVSHTYMRAENVVPRFADSGLSITGLDVFVLPCLSWYKPGHTTAVVIARSQEIELLKAREW